MELNKSLRSSCVLGRTTWPCERRSLLGVATNLCVESTGRCAGDLGYQAMNTNRVRLMIDVGIAPAAAAEDTALVNELAALVNSVYALAEEGLWADGTPRTTPEGMAALIAAGQIAVARADTSNRWRRSDPATARR